MFSSERYGSRCLRRRRPARCTPFPMCVTWSALQLGTNSFGSGWTLFSTTLRSSCENQSGLHQSYIKERGGYTAEEWSTPNNPALAGNEAYRLWGGGQELSPQQISSFLDLIGSLLALSDELLHKELLSQVPGWQKNTPSANNTAVLWAARQLGRMEREGLTIAPLLAEFRRREFRRRISSGGACW